MVNFLALRSAFFCSLAFLAVYSPAHAVELSIHNELREDESGSLLVIEEAKSFESPKSNYRINVYPGKTVRVTKGNVSHFVLVRPFERHKLKYEISCPQNEEGVQATVTMLDIHRGNLPAGCTVDRHGHWSRRTGIKWGPR